MKKPVLAVCLAAFFVLPAMAADQNVPAKPPVKQVAFPYYSSGWYAGIGSFASSTNPSADGNTAGNLQALGASIGVVGGYRWAGQNFGIDLEGSAFYNNVGGDSACAGGVCTVGAKFSSIERVKFGADLQTIVSLFPNLGLPHLPTTPPDILNNVSDQRFYAFAGADIDDVSASFNLESAGHGSFRPALALGPNCS